MPPRVSVVIPNFNSGHQIERAITSVLNQRYPHVELIVVDGGSTDASADIVRAYASDRARVIVGPDRGPHDAINKGFAMATGDIFGWLGADDELLPSALHDVASEFENRPIDVLVGRCERVFADGTTTIVAPTAEDLPYLPLRNAIDQPSTFWTRDLWERAGPLDLSYALAFDHELWCRFIQSGATVAITDHVLSRYHFSTLNKTSVGGRMHVQEQFRIVKQYGPRRGLSAYALLLLYHRYDLAGCLDVPSCAGRWRSLEHRAVRRLLQVLVGEATVGRYNWHFASLQERGLRWW